MRMLKGYLNVSYWHACLQTIPHSLFRRAGAGLQVHTVGSKSHDEESEAGEWLIKGFDSLVELDRWKQNDGADFVIFDPHPGFTDGRTDLLYKKYICSIMQKSMHIVVETGQRNICKVG